MKSLGFATVFLSPSVYEPSDDSYALLEALEDVRGRGIAIDIGCGTGILSIALARKGFLTICVDISPCAAYCARETMSVNEVDNLVDVVQCDSGSCMRSGVAKVVIFNPPYLPVSDSVNGATSWSGGVGGVEIALKFLRDAVRICGDDCRILFVVSSLQKFEVLVNALADKCRDIVVEWKKSFFYERIGIVDARGCSDEENQS